ncbi:MAG TPA: hypothetical protein VGD62_00520 [Acidobacteriaceae bacterium]
MLTLEGYEVVSAASIQHASQLFRERPFSLVLIDVEGDNSVPHAQELCGRIKEERPEQKVAFVCNDWVSLESECPDKLIHSEFNPGELLRGIRELVA